MSLFYFLEKFLWKLCDPIGTNALMEKKERKIPFISKRKASIDCFWGDKCVKEGAPQYEWLMQRSLAAFAQNVLYVRRKMWNELSKTRKERKKRIKKIEKCFM